MQVDVSGFSAGQWPRWLGSPDIRGTWHVELAIYG
jgi:hypothetical protein